MRKIYVPIRPYTYVIWNTIGVLSYCCIQKQGEAKQPKGTQTIKEHTSAISITIDTSQIIVIVFFFCNFGIRCGTCVVAMVFEVSPGRHLSVEVYPRRHRMPQGFSYAISPRRRVGIQMYPKHHRKPQRFKNNGDCPS